MAKSYRGGGAISHKEGKSSEGKALRNTAYSITLFLHIVLGTRLSFSGDQKCLWISSCRCQRVSYITHQWIILYVTYGDPATWTKMEDQVW